MEKLRVAELNLWAQANLTTNGSIVISASFRPGSHYAHVLQILELDGVRAPTARILIPRHAPIMRGNITPNTFSNKGADWWNGWAAVLVAAALIPPKIDPIRLKDLLHEKRRIRLFCDTNALCSGVASWLLEVFQGRVDIITSAVVDRELQAWPDRDGGKMWKAKTVTDFKRRTHYRIARRLIENPSYGVVIDRLSPEQDALMLAKVRDETEAKSPDADILLIELARAVIRDQPRNARVVYLTGDNNNARAATNALGATNVLYAIADAKYAQRHHGEIVSRGWWYPNGPLGSVVIPSLGSLFWNILSAATFIHIETSDGIWRMGSLSSFEHGVPSDWVDPWVQIDKIYSPPPPAVVASVETLEPETEDEDGQEDIDPPPVPNSETETQATHPSNRFLLPPVEIGFPVSVSASLRPSPRVFFNILWQVLSGDSTSNNERISLETEREIRRILVALEAIDSENSPARRIEEFRSAWMRNDLDWFHAEMLRLPGYKTTIDGLRQDPSMSFSQRQAANLSMAKSLGQIARPVPSSAEIFVGDKPVTSDELISALERWLPEAEVTMFTSDICSLAQTELQLTPARFEKAQRRLWELYPGLPFEGRTGGSVVIEGGENIVTLSQDGYFFHLVTPGNISFGRNGPVRFITRV